MMQNLDSEDTGGPWGLIAILAGIAIIGGAMGGWIVLRGVDCG